MHLHKTEFFVFFFILCSIYNQYKYGDRKKYVGFACDVKSDCYLGYLGI